MAATLTVIFWRDVPAQVVAKAGRRTHKIVLHPRFQATIDKAAMRAGKKQWDDYIGEWRKETRPCSDDVEAEATAEAARLEAQYDKHVLARLVLSGGLASDEAPSTGQPA